MDYTSDPVHEMATGQGPGRVHLAVPGRPVGLLALGHGAGGGVHAPDLKAAAGAAAGLRFATALIEQPYRVADRRSPPPAPRLDEAWLELLAGEWRAPLAGLPLVVGGRSSGARVACRTAHAAGAAGVLCLAFPLVPPHRPGSARPPAPSRLPELEAVSVPVLIVQGAGDPFGMPPAAPGRQVVTVAGNHSLRSSRAAVATAVEDWLRGLPGG